MERNKRLYNIWACMKQRCNNPNHTAAAWYHDKGIRVCEQWEKDFTAFQKWAIENGYFEGGSIDRIDPEKDYSPENCRWITLDENRKRAGNIKKTGEIQKNHKYTKGKFMVVKHRRNEYMMATVIKTGLTKPEAGKLISRIIGERKWDAKNYSVFVTDGRKEGHEISVFHCRTYLKQERKTGQWKNHK